MAVTPSLTVGLLPRFILPLSLSIPSETIIRQPVSPALLLNRTHVASHLRKSIRRFCLAAIIVASVCAVVRTQTAGRGWEWQNPLPQGNAISAIRFAGDKLHGWAVGADGVILYTADGGFRWENQPTRLINALNGLYVFDRQHAFAVGARGLILETRNGGEKWIEIKTPAKDHLYSITFAADDRRHGWAVGTYGCIVTTSDGGASWSSY